MLGAAEQVAEFHHRTRKDRLLSVQAGLARVSSSTWYFLSVRSSKTSDAGVRWNLDELMEFFSG